MTSDIEITDDMKGDNYDITINDFSESDDLADISTFDNVTLKVKTTDLATEVLSKALTKPGSKGLVRWTIEASDFTSVPAGDYLAKVVVSDSGNTIIRETEPPMTMIVHPKFNT